MSPEDALKNLLGMMKALLKTEAFELPLPSANADLIASALTPTNPVIPVIFRVAIAVSKTGTLSATLTRGGTTIVIQLNGGVALIPDTLYSFDIPVSYGDDFNLQVSVANGTVRTLRVLEIPEGI